MYGIIIAIISIGLMQVILYLRLMFISPIFPYDECSHSHRLLKESGDIFHIYVNDEFLTYCNIYQFIPCKMGGWGKLSEKTFEELQNNYIFRISSI